MTRSTWALAALLSFVMGALSWAPVRRGWGAIHVLLDLASPPASQRPSTSDVVIEGTPPFRARIYHPAGPVHRCVVIGHGVHHLGIEEPRLTRFAAELSRAGAVVLTPELADLADYRITRGGADVLGAAARYLGTHCPRGNRVGLLGFSFAGGLSLLAATDPAVSGSLVYVASVGGYHELERVLHFLLTDTVETPDGPQHRVAHEYGAVVLLYGYLDHFVPKADLRVTRAAVRAWLEEDRPRAWALASERTTLQAEQLFIRLAGGHVAEMRRELAALLDHRSDELDALSPRGRLSRIPVPVYLLHGSGDSVIPPEETLWADRELGFGAGASLVTPLIEHVEVSGQPRILDQLALVRFMARLL